jgi:hypothetical protein
VFSTYKTPRVCGGRFGHDLITIFTHEKYFSAVKTVKTMKILGLYIFYITKTINFALDQVS